MNKGLFHIIEKEKTIVMRQYLMNDSFEPCFCKKCESHPCIGLL